MESGHAPAWSRAWRCREGSGRLGEEAEIEFQHLPHPQRMVAVIGQGVAGIRVNDDGEAVPVEGEPRDEVAKSLGSKAS